MTDLETQLRATLAERANEAPRGGPLADRVLTEVSAPMPVLRPRRTWRTWSLPLLAAAAVASIVATVVGIGHMHSNAAGHSHIGTRTHSGGISGVPSATVQISPTPHTSKPATHVVPPQVRDPGGVTGFRVIDLTFVGLKDGWAIGTANCVSGPGLCTAMFRTTDGTTWQSMPGAVFNVPMPNDACTAPCVEHIRFATPSVGYAYGPTTLFMTTDGGASWTPQSGGGAEALEMFNGNVIRVVSPHTGCPGLCDITVETAPIGSSSWQHVRLGAGQISADGVQLTRSSTSAYILLTGNPAGGGDATSTLYSSIDNGASWTAHGEPCPQTDGEVDSVALTASAPNTVSALCAIRQSSGTKQFLVISHNDGTSFTRADHRTPGTASILVGDPTTELLLAGSGGTYRSTDAGAHWAPMTQFRNVSWLGFESSSLGRAVNNAGRTIWTTRDGGHSWTPFRFS